MASAAASRIDPSPDEPRLSDGSRSPIFVATPHRILHHQWVTTIEGWSWSLHPHRLTSRFDQGLLGHVPRGRRAQGLVKRQSARFRAGGSPCGYGGSCGPPGGARRCSAPGRRADRAGCPRWGRGVTDAGPRRGRWPEAPSPRAGSNGVGRLARSLGKVERGCQSVREALGNAPPLLPAGAGMADATWATAARVPADVGQAEPGPTQGQPIGSSGGAPVCSSASSQRLRSTPPP